MGHTRKAILAVVLGSALALPTSAGAQSRGRAVPRGGTVQGGGGARPAAGVAVPRPGGPVYPGHPIYPGRPGYPYYGYGYPSYGHAYYGYPYYAYGYPWYGSFSFGLSFGYPAYGYPAYAVPSYGGVRINVAQRNAEVLVDGYYAGVVDDFDGSFQQLNLEPGPHSIEVHAQGFEPVTFDVNIMPGRTVRYRTSLRQALP